MQKQYSRLGLVAVLAIIFIIAGCSEQQKGPVEITGLDKNTTTIQCEENPCIYLEKTGHVTAKPGEVITYHFMVTNCGDVPLCGVKVYDPLFGSNPIWSGDLQPGQSAEFDKTYTLPEDDCSDFTNTARAEGYTSLTKVTDVSSWTVDVICEPEGCQTDLIAGQNWDSPAGVVTVYDDGEYLYVNFVTTDGWSLGETHLYVGTESPKKSAPGKFPYKGQTEYIIPLSDFDSETLYIAAHAVVSRGGQQETAWADSYGIEIPRGGWGMYFGYNVGGGCFNP